MRFIKFLSRQLILMIIFLVIISIAENKFGLNTVKGDCEGGGGPVESFLLIPSVFACGDSGSTGGGGSAGNQGSDPGTSNGDPNDSSSGGGDPTNGGSGGGSNQNDTGDEGNNNGGEEGSGSVGGCSLANVIKTVAGYVYLDANQNKNYDLTLVAADGRKDSGLGGQIIQIYMAAYTVPAHTIAGWEEVTGTDENGTPTGSVWHDPVFVPDAYHPEVVYAQVATDQSGHYTTQVPMSSNYQIRHIPQGVSGFTRTAPLTDSVAANISCNFTQSFGVYISASSTPSPAADPTPAPSGTTTSPPPAATPTPAPSSAGTAPVVSISINGQQSGLVAAVEVTQNPASQAALSWQVSNTPANSCTAAVTPTGSSTSVPAGITAIWNGIKGPPSAAAYTSSPIAIPTNLPGSYIFDLTCVGSGTTKATLRLNINQYPPAYFQTTGGDVHSNQNIHISQ